MIPTHAQLLALKRDDPRAYWAYLDELEGKRSVEPIGPVEAGAPAQAAGVKTHETDFRGVIRRPSWSTSTVNTILDDALDYAPDPHYAAHVAKALGLQGWTLNVLVPGTDEPDEIAKAEVEAFSGRIARPYGGGIDALLTVGLDSVLRRGAVALELDVADTRDDVIDVGLVDPAVIDFQVRTEGAHSTIVPVYAPNAGVPPVPLSEQTFCYIGSGVKVGKPHGQSPFLPLVDTTYPQSKLRDNMARVADQQGFSRLAFTIDSGKAIDQAPPEVVSRLSDGTVQVHDWQRYKAYLNGLRSDMETLVENMYADDTWVLYDTIKPGAVGADHSTQSFKPLEITQVFDQDAIVACLGQPAIHGRNWGAALSTTGGVQWMTYTLGLEGLRAIPKHAVEWALNQYLRIRGLNAIASLEFEPISKGDAVRDATADEIRTRTVAAQVTMGVMTLDEAAELLTGHDAPETVTGLPAAAPGERTLVRIADSGVGIPGHDGAGRGHQDGCDCDECSESWQRDPWETDDSSEDPDLSEFEDVTDADARRQRRTFDKWAKRKAPVFVGLLAAHMWREGKVPPGWVYEVPKARYRYPTRIPGVFGKPLPAARLNDLFTRRLATSREMAQAATRALLDKKIDVGYWQRQMATQIRNGHLEARMIGVGGQGGMSPYHYQQLADRISKQNEYLKRFAGQIRAGELTDKQIAQRAESYLQSAVRGTRMMGMRDSARQAGCNYEKNVLGVADHCHECEDLSSRGWVPLGELPLIGERACNGNCACEVVYQAVEAGEEAGLNVEEALA